MRAVHSVVLSLDAKPGPIYDAYQRGGKFVSGFDPPEGRPSQRAGLGHLGGGRRSLLLDLAQLLFPPLDCIPNQVAGVLSGKATGVHLIGVDRALGWCAGVDEKCAGVGGKGTRKGRLRSVGEAAARAAGVLVARVAGGHR